MYIGGGLVGLVVLVVIVVLVLRILKNIILFMAVL